MSKFFIVVVVLFASFAGYGCLSSSGSSPNAPVDVDGGPPEAGVPVQTFDGSVNVDSGTTASLTTGLGSGVVATSAHFKLITKTGQEPGGSGVKTSSSFKVISGAAPAAATK